MHQHLAKMCEKREKTTFSSAFGLHRAKRLLVEISNNSDNVDGEKCVFLFVRKEMKKFKNIFISISM